MDTINFQIQYFPEDKKDEYKDWCKKDDSTMKSKLLAILENKDEIQKVLDKANK